MREPLETLTIERRFHGPPDSGNGGYVAGLLARVVASPGVEVKLRVPPPLARPLAVERLSHGGAVLLDGEAVVAQARPAMVDLAVPAGPSLAEATRASEAFTGFAEHVFPTCFVCGPARAPGDGLRIFPGPVGTTEVLACPWTPHASLDAGNGTVRPEFVWAALDCGGAFTHTAAAGQTVVLGLLAAALHAPVAIATAHVVMAWPLGVEGRKHFAGTALAAADGTVLARAQATWIAIDRR